MGVGQTFLTFSSYTFPLSDLHLSNSNSNKKDSEKLRECSVTSPMHISHDLPLRLQVPHLPFNIQSSDRGFNFRGDDEETEKRNNGIEKTSFDSTLPP